MGNTAATAVGAPMAAETQQHAAKRALRMARGVRSMEELVTTVALQIMHGEIGALLQAFHNLGPGIC